MAGRNSVAWNHHWGGLGSAAKYFRGSEYFDCRWCETKDINGNWFQGTLLEGAATNLLKRSRELDHTDWTSVAGAESANAANGMEGTATMDGIVGNSSDTQHGVTQAATLTAVTHVLSALCRVGNKNWAYLFNSTVANCYSYFDIPNLASGTKGAGATSARIIDLGGGLIRCRIKFTGTAAAHTVGIYAAHANEDNDFSGDGATSNIHVEQMQLEPGHVMTSPIVTAGASATRAADQTIQLPGGLNLGGEDRKRFTITIPYLNPGYDPGNNTLIYRISDGGSAADAITLSVDTSDQLTATVDASGGTTRTVVGGSITDHARHMIQLAVEPGRLTLFIDNVHQGENTSIVAADIPDDLDRREIFAPTVGWHMIGREEIFPSAEHGPVASYDYAR